MTKKQIDSGLVEKSNSVLLFKENYSYNVVSCDEDMEENEWRVFNSWKEAKKSFSEIVKNRKNNLRRFK